jgi:hypothetical protein
LFKFTALEAAAAADLIVFGEVLPKRNDEAWSFLAGIVVKSV